MPNLKETDKKTGEAFSAVNDEELDAVAGGYGVVFQDTGENRDSWFVSLMVRRMVQDEIRRALASPAHEVPNVVTVGNRLFRVRKLGKDYYVEEIRG